MGWELILAGVFVFLVGDLACRKTGDALWQTLEIPPERLRKHRPHPWLAPLMGHVDRLLYVAALEMAWPAFIGLWLVLKAVGHWRSPERRSIYNVFLIVNGISVLYAVVGWKMLQWARAEDWKPLVIYPVALIVLTVVFYNLLPETLASGDDAPWEEE